MIIQIPFYNSHSLPMLHKLNLIDYFIKNELSVSYVRTQGLRKRMLQATMGKMKGKLARKIFYSIFYTFDTVHTELIDIFLFNANSWMHVRSGAGQHASYFKY